MFQGTSGNQAYSTILFSYPLQEGQHIEGDMLDSLAVMCRPGRPCVLCPFLRKNSSVRTNCALVTCCMKARGKNELTFLCHIVCATLTN